MRQGSAHSLHLRGRQEEFTGDVNHKPAEPKRLAKINGVFLLDK